MILNTELSHDAEYIGNVQENRVGIDKSNLDFITTLLTSNLYSKPLESFLRETVANAHDSHVEAGTDERILLLIQDKQNDSYSSNTYRISIRDYGTGVSPERFEKIYKNVGSSTKRESNDYIGMFGIGRFSCLSCADVAHITSYYQGKKYSYVMYKNGGGINIDQLSIVEGNFKDGLEVSIEKYLYSPSPLIEAFDGLCMFEKLYICYEGNREWLKERVKEFNNRQITHFKTFSKCSLITGRNLYKVGNVIYKGEQCDLSTRDGLIIDLPMGSVDITPNREALQFTDYTNKSIVTQVKAVKEELQELVNSRLNADMSLSEFYTNFIEHSDYKIVEKGVDLRIDESDVSVIFDSVTIEGEQISGILVNVLKSIQYTGPESDLIHKTIKNNSRYRGNGYTVGNIILGNITLIDKKDKITKAVTLQYTIENSTNTSVILTYGGLEEFKKALCAKVMDDYDFKARVNRTAPLDAKEVEKCIDFIFKHLPIQEMSNDSVPQDFIESFKSEQRSKKKKVVSTSIPIRYYYCHSYSSRYLKDLPATGLVIYSAHTKDDSTLRALGDLCHYIKGLACVITIKSEYIKMLEGNKRFITAENFMFIKNSVLTKFATAYVIRYYFRKLESAHGINSFSLPIWREFTTKYKEQCNCLYYWRDSSAIETIVNYYKSKGWLNNSDVAYFSLSAQEIQGYKNWMKLEAHKNDLVQSIAFKKYGKLPKIGLNPVIAPKLL